VPSTPTTISRLTFHVCAVCGSSFAGTVGTLEPDPTSGSSPGHESGLDRPAAEAEVGRPDLYSILDRTRPGRADEHLGLFHQTLVDHILARTNSRAAHQAIADTLDKLASADRHDPKSYRNDPLLVYAFDAGPRHLSGAKQFERLVGELGRRQDPVPRVNLARWSSWTTSVQRCPGPDHPGTLATRSNVASWTGQVGDASEALRLSRKLLPDRERVLGPDHPATLATRGGILFWAASRNDQR